MAAVETLASLEARFAALERRILGNGAIERAENETVAGLLTDASASMRAALSGRDKAASIVPRMGELDRYLDPTFEDSLDAPALVELLVSAGPDLVERRGQLERLGELSPALDSDAIAGVAAHGGRVERLLSAGLEGHELGEESRARVYALVQEYNAIIVGLTKTLVQWDDVVTQLELERRPKKVVE